MEIQSELDLRYKQISANEQDDIENQIEDHIVEHLYKSNVTAIITGFLSTLAIFLYFYKHTEPGLLIGWFAAFSVMLFLISLVTVLYNRYKFKFGKKTWEIALAAMLQSCAMLWGMSAFISPDDLVRQQVLVSVLFMLAAAYSLDTVGLFNLCFICLSFILIPSAVWMFAQPGHQHMIGGASIIIYYVFLLIMNRRSSIWLRNSLRLKIENSVYTYQSNHDLITDLPNQRLLLSHLDACIQKANDKNESFAVLCFGINRLEMFNNNLGYQAGDLIVQALSKRFKSLLTEINESFKDTAELKDNTFYSMLALPRPDAFIVVIKDASEQQLKKTIDKLFLVLDSPFYLGKREAKLTANTGISIFPKDGDSSRVILSNAYTAMFQAKGRGANQIEYYKREVNEKTPFMLELENDLYQALALKQLVVYYQPFIDLKTKKVSGMEALIRWNHPKHGLISPLDFIPIAEETGLILPIGEFILEEACAKTAEWHTKGFDFLSLKVAVNLSVKQLRQGDLLKSVERVLEKTKLDSSYIELELTETEMLDERLLPIIKELTRRGVTLSIDDFGTGYSGLSYLKVFEVDKIKIDKTFIQDVTNNNDSATIVSAILAMAKELGIKTLAEGVETKEQLQFLIERGCQYIQGYYFSKPLEAKQFEDFIRSNKQMQQF